MMTVTPTLAKKLGVTPGTRVALVGAPKGFTLDLPDGAHLRRGVRGDVDVILAFFHVLDKLEHELERLVTAVYPDGSLWIAWPKKASKVATDLTDHVVRRIVLPLGLVDNKVCAVDDTYSALRFVWRRSQRALVRHRSSN